MDMAISNKFRGCLIGGLIGDCLGAPFEGERRISKTVLNNYFKKLEDPSTRVPYKTYTDDTAMMKSLAHSFVETNELNIKDIAKRFVKEYYSEPNRGYGENVTDIFASLRATQFKDIFAPAACQFGGSGSYGNGAAMRTSPVALFFYSKPTDILVDTAKQIALITHANRLGYNGAILQCIAIHEVLKLKSGSLNSLNYLDYLISLMQKVEKYTEDEIIDGKPTDPFVYVPALERVRFMLEKGNDVSVSEVQDYLGNDVSAHRSVPTAIYSFLRAQNDIKEVKADNPVVRTVHYAISLGGDTDTIATMAGSIAGAYYGLEPIPEILQKHCEAIEEVTSLAEKLCQH